jgi:hypothetical protein
MKPALACTETPLRFVFEISQLTAANLNTLAGPRKTPGEQGTQGNRDTVLIAAPVASRNQTWIFMMS